MTISQRRFRILGITVGLVLLNLVCLNWLSLDHFIRLDLTRDRVHTLHPSTVELLENLDDLVSVQVFLSEKKFLDQPRYALFPRQLHDLLDEFTAVGAGKVRIDFLDPTDDSELAREARSLGVAEVPVTGMDQQTAVMFKAYSGMVISYGGKEEVLPLVDEVDNLEYRLALLLSHMVRRELITIGFNALNPVPENMPPAMALRAGKDTKDIDRNWQPIRDALSQQYEVEKVVLTAEVPAHISLLVVHNVVGMNPQAQFYLDQYLMTGGKVIFLVDGVDMNPAVKAWTAVTSLPDAFFAHYGFSIRRNLIFDKSCLVAPSQAGDYLSQFWVPHLQTRYFDHDSPLMNGLEPFYLVLPSSVELNPPEGIQALVLAQSSPGAWQQEGFFSVRTDMRPPNDLNDFRQFDLVALLKGEFTSFFNNRPIPEGVTISSRGPTREEFERQGFVVEEWDDEEDSDTVEEEGPESLPQNEIGDGEHIPGGGLSLSAMQDSAGDGEEDEEISEPSSEGSGAAFIRSRSPETSIVVVANARFLESQSAGLPGNLSFLWTLVDRMTSGSSLSGIRNRQATPPSVRADLKPGEKAAVKYLGMLAMPVLVLLAGLTGLALRQRRKRGAA